MDAKTSVKKGHSENNFRTTIVALVEVSAFGTSAVFDLHRKNIYPINISAKSSPGRKPAKKSRPIEVSVKAP